MVERAPPGPPTNLERDWPSVVASGANACTRRLSQFIRAASHWSESRRDRRDVGECRFGKPERTDRGGDPEKYPTQSAIGSTGGEIGERSADRTPRDREKEQSHTLVHRRRLLRLHHAASHSAKHPRKSRLVHCLHAVPGRTCSGSSRSAA